ncbi:hypothetical protein [Alcanivorax sp.]|uniref:hypothetical protein n=1 Tax=Alcanivorax sp. TaxID=1872427 RepID=UPI000C0F8CAE|nr:hypothetical protein [Alcanivorax sp.]PHR66110.1 MAG: hypothetical protein COA55_10245 [Alcanivorax sp.]
MLSANQYIFIIFAAPLLLLATTSASALLIMKAKYQNKKKTTWIILVLEYATSNESFSFYDLCEKTKLTKEQKEQLRWMIHDKQILSNPYSNFRHHTRIENGKHEKSAMLYAGAEDHFKLLEYVELQEARASSRTANKFAIAALIVSIISFSYSAYQSKKSMNTAIKLPARFYEVMQGIPHEKK